MERTLGSQRARSLILTLPVTKKPKTARAGWWPRPGQLVKSRETRALGAGVRTGPDGSLGHAGILV